MTTTSETAATVRTATEADLAPLSEVLGRAFADYAWTRWALPEEGYSERLVEVQALYLRHALRHGVVLTDAGLRGVVALLPVDAPEPDAATVRRVVELHGERAGRLAVETPRAGEPGDWRVETIAVDPAAQGGGVGAALLRAAADAVAGRDAAAGLALETSDPRNVRFYERWGFRVTAEARVAGGPRVWAMRRGASARASGAPSEIRP